MVVWNWWAHDFVKDKDEFGDTLLMFKVNWAKFKGSVWITLNYNDSFHIYFVDKRCMLKWEEPEVYVETLLNTIDKFVETN